MSAAEPNPQTSINEVTVENDLLERALETRETARQAKGEANKAYSEAHERVKSLAASLDELEDDVPVRVGRFVLTKKAVAGRSVSFETNPSSRLQISLVGED